MRAAVDGVVGQARSSEARCRRTSRAACRAVGSSRLAAGAASRWWAWPWPAPTSRRGSAMPFDPSRRIFLKGAGAGRGRASASRPPPLLTRAAEAARRGAARAGAGLPARRRGRPEPLRPPRRCELLRPAAARIAPARWPTACATSTASSACTPASRRCATSTPRACWPCIPTIGQRAAHALALRRPGLHGHRHPRRQDDARRLARPRVARQIPGEDVMQLVAVSLAHAALGARAASRRSWPQDLADLRRARGHGRRDLVGGGGPAPARACTRRLHAPCARERPRGLRRHRRASATTPALPLRPPTAPCIPAAPWAPGCARPRSSSGGHRHALHLRQRARLLRHARQPARRPTTRSTRPLAAALVAFRRDLGSRIDDVLLMVTTEFGRTAARERLRGHRPRLRALRALPGRRRARRARARRAGRASPGSAQRGARPAPSPSTSATCSSPPRAGSGSRTRAR